LFVNNITVNDITGKLSHYRLQTFSIDEDEHVMPSRNCQQSMQGDVPPQQRPLCSDCQVLLSRYAVPT